MERLLWKWLRNKEFVQFFDRLDALLIDYNLESLGLVAGVEALIPFRVEFDERLNHTKRERFTPELKNVDRKRRDQVRAVKRLLEAYELSGIERVQVAVKEVKTLFSHPETTVERLSMTALSSTIMMIEEALSKDKKWQGYVDVLNIQEFLDLLFQSNADFEALYHNRLSVNATNVRSSRAIRRDLIIHYDYFILALDYNRIYNPTGEYIRLLEKINRLVFKFNSIIEIRRSKAALETRRSINQEEIALSFLNENSTQVSSMLNSNTANRASNSTGSSDELRIPPEEFEE